ncbi:MAG TPA: hypothetical protein VEZ12_01410 [Herpetosiphonaceae bacterium]|nr:hypothetical protein [Herpetosiphonaceae bacterium]
MSRVDGAMIWFAEPLKEAALKIADHRPRRVQGYADEQEQSANDTQEDRHETIAEREMACLGMDLDTAECHEDADCCDYQAIQTKEQ